MIVGPPPKKNAVYNEWMHFRTTETKHNPNANTNPNSNHNSTNPTY